MDKKRLKGNKVHSNVKEKNVASKRHPLVSSDRNGGNSNEQSALQAGSKKFEEARARIQESLQKFVNEGDEYASSSSEDEMENQNDILQSLLASYSQIGGGDGRLSSEMGRTKQFLNDAFKSDSSVCLICIATIKKTEAIWSCASCYGIFHLPCIQKWSKDSIFYQEQASPVEIDKTKLLWFCPKCRAEYKQNEKPTKYLCFCTKECDPKFDPWLFPHTCGQRCDKQLKPQCGHSCLLLCHPGPCPPCPKTVKASCFCGNQNPQVKRCSNREWSCGQPCKRLLSCKQHSCKQLCHAGECNPCPRQSLQLCLCGRSKIKRPCASPVWQCETVCGKSLSCGHHQCSTVCHEGSCPSCPRTGERSCPCGKSKVQLPCTEDVTPCGDTCGKVLECGFHPCSDRCHFGPCSTCLQLRVKRCRCGHREKSVPCCKDFRCETKCKVMRDCGRHPCNRKCCDGECPPCEQQCGRNLSCHNHKCNSRCHGGPCYPCPLIVNIGCTCGAATITVPCGREKSTKPPRCNELCRTPPNCHHPLRKPHRCHFGSCPPCRQVCLKNFPNCNHKCLSKCHSAVEVKVTTNKKREGPWEPAPAPETKVVNQPCPPCQIPVPVTCRGKHEISDFPCSEARPYSCGQGCGRQLACGNHTCSLACHEVINAPNATEAGDGCEVCEQACSKPRPNGCVHPCLKTCHPQACEPCKQMIKIRCHCNLNSLYINCNEWFLASEAARTEKSRCGNRCPKNLSCGHLCPNTCHPDACPNADTCKKKVPLRCPCKRIKKEVICNQVSKSKIACNAQCNEQKEQQMKMKEEEEKKKEEEELKKQQEELDKYHQKMERKKHRKRHRSQEAAVCEPFHVRHFKVVVGSVICMILSIVGYYLSTL